MNPVAAGNEKQRREDVCAAIAAQLLGGRFERRDENGGVQVHDFDLVFEDGAIEALEVCSFTDSTVREQWSLIDRVDEIARELGSTWTVSLTADARVKGLPAALEQHLLVLERNGVGRYLAGDHFPLLAEVHAAERDGRTDAGKAAVVEAMLSLTRLGVLDAVEGFTRPGEAPRVVIAAGAGGAGTSALLNRVVQHVSLKRDNRLKLQAAKRARRRHIFIPVDPSAGVAWTLAGGDTPAQPPRLPSGVELAWVLGRGGRVLLFEAGTWRSLAVDPAVWDDANRWRLDTGN